MLFNSLEFLLFLPVVFYAYYLIPHRLRWPLLLVSSYYFYMSWRVEYALLIATSTIVDYVVALQLGKRDNPRTRKALLATSLVVNLGLLGVFKYAGFFARSVNESIDLIGLGVSIPVPDLLLPVGISFYTFQTLGYTIDVYRRQIAPERHLGHFGLYVVFWPQLVAGPIERAHRLMPQLKKRVAFDNHRVVEGLQLILWGLFKKVVVADRVAGYVNEVYNHPDMYYGPAVLVATVLFAFQIFCDFSGYSDIAIGSARMLGIDLMNNFERPYYARTISEFWRRWHISLSTWFRDYVYIPLGGSRVAKPRWLSNLFITFLVSGIWHGANWTFAVWGALHGTYLIMGIVTEGLRRRLSAQIGLDAHPRIEGWLNVGFNFVLVCLAWVFFRANSVGDALTLLRHAVDFRETTILVNMPDCGLELTMGIGAIVVMELIHRWQGTGTIPGLIQRQKVGVRWAVYFGTAMAILLFGNLIGPQFIYFQF